MAIIGLDIGGTKLLGAVFNDEGQIIEQYGEDISSYMNYFSADLKDMKKK